jgi:7-cyano-7-deazaguanine tRNA-ribosyltransferase
MDYGSLSKYASENNIRSYPKIVQIVAGLNLNNLQPKVFDVLSPYYLPNLQSVMVSYAEFDHSPTRHRRAMEEGLHVYLGIPKQVEIYLDNGAFSFLKRNKEVPREAYKNFVKEAKPNWYAIPQDYIPTPQMSDEQQLDCMRRTMQVNQDFRDDGYVPVVHISRCLDEYLRQLQADQQLQAKPMVALGGIVPNLLKMPKAMKPESVLNSVRQTRTELIGKQLHVFGVGGTATLHLAALLGVDSVDSSGWRNRAARGIIQLSGRGERIVANLGGWRGRKVDEEELEMLRTCQCPACQHYGIEGLQIGGLQGFCNRATHNLWILLEEGRQIDEHLAAGTYTNWYLGHVQNSNYLSLIEQAVAWL